MKIAQIAPLYEAVPPSLCGGTERDGGGWRWRQIRGGSHFLL
jgi:hypothetical protein